MNNPWNNWKFYLSARDAWGAMYRDCEQATQTIELEQYIMGNDALGRRFLKLFIRKAEEGVKVFVLCDKFGSMELVGSSLVRKLRRRGGKFYFYNPISWWNLFTPWRWFPRTHIKTLVVDASVAYIGSTCMAQHMEQWRDTQVRLTGPGVTDIRRSFDPRMRHPYRSQFSSTRTEYFRYVLNHPQKSSYNVYREIVGAVEKAQQYIYISAPFFIPNDDFFFVIEGACQRGVDVRLLVPETSDVRLADWILLSYSDRLLDAGVRIFLYKPSNMHAKTAVIDDCWATVGSTNFDVVSFFHNRESNLIITQPEAIAELKRHFFDDMAYCRELTHDDWSKFPTWKKLLTRCLRTLKVFF